MRQKQQDGDGQGGDSQILVYIGVLFSELNGPLKENQVHQGSSCFFLGC